MKRLFIVIIASWGLIATVSAQLSVTSPGKSPIEVTPDAGTGLKAVYVAYDADNIVLSYKAQDSGDVKWFVFHKQGAAYAEEVEATREGEITTIVRPMLDCGYVIEEGAKRTYFWVVDYSQHRVSINNISFADEQDCGLATLEVDAVCDKITFYSITGVPKTLSREIGVEYSSLGWDAENTMYNPITVDNVIDNLDGRLVLEAPLCNTSFAFSLDRFLKEWGEEIAYTTDTYTTKSIEVQAFATQTERNNDNERKEGGDMLGGSAPAEIAFEAYCTDAVAYKEWQISRDADFSGIDLRYNEESTTYTFRENGVYYVRFVASNDDASCSTESDVFTVSIGESVLECPNAFSPEASPGHNDVWKVSYKSIVKFDCWIFDRYGNEIIHFSDPSQGWDGKRKGKYVKSGVYYYVIEAEGADGKKYKKKGDINIIKSTRNDSQNESME